MEFNFDVSALDKPLHVVFKARSYEDIGITKSLYKLCEVIDQSYHDSWNRNVNTSIVNYYGFDSIEEFKEIYARARLYNALKYNPEQTLRQYISSQQQKIEHHFGTSISLKRKSDELNMLDFLNSFTLEQLFCLGW